MNQSEDEETIYSHYGPRGPMGHAITLSATTGSAVFPAYPTVNSTPYEPPSFRSFSLLSPASPPFPIPARRISSSSVPLSSLSPHVLTNHIPSAVPAATAIDTPSKSPIILTNQITSLHTRFPSQLQLSPFPISSSSHADLHVAPPPLPPRPFLSHPSPILHLSHLPCTRSPPRLPVSLRRCPADLHTQSTFIRTCPQSRSTQLGQTPDDYSTHGSLNLACHSVHPQRPNCSTPPMSSFNASSGTPNGEGDDLDPSRKKKTCVSCGKKVYDNFTECPHCTTLFRDPGGKVVRCGRVGKKVCLQCGFSNPVRCFTCKRCDYLFQPKPKIVKPPAKRGRKPKNKNNLVAPDRSKSVTGDHSRSHDQHLGTALTLRHDALHGQEPMHDQDETRRSSSSSPDSPSLPFASAPSHVNLRVRSPSALSPNGPSLHSSSSPVPSIPGLTTSSHARLSSITPTARTASNSGSASASASGSATDGGMGVLHSSALPMTDHPKLLPLPSSFMPPHQTHRHPHEHDHTHGHRHRSHLHPR